MAPKIGLSISFQIHPGRGESWDTSYRESLELASEADRLGFEFDLGQRASRRGRRLLPLARRGLRRPGGRRTPLPHRPGRGAGAAAWPSAAAGRGPVGGRQPVRRPGRDRLGTGLSPRRVRELRLELQDAHAGVRGVAGHPGAGLARRALRLPGPHLHRERRPAAPAADQARRAAALDRRRGAEGAGARGALSRRADRGAADRAAAPRTPDQVVRR